MNFIIAIDGPSGAGKTTVAKAIASKTDLNYVDTGALYRALGVYAKSKGVDVKSHHQLAGLLPNCHIILEWHNLRQLVIINGNDMTPLIRTPEASMLASDISTMPIVRDFLLQVQRDTAEATSVVMEGRDIGTVIFPNADIKIFLTADLETRAHRRLNQLNELGEMPKNSDTYQRVLQEMKDRDYQDSNRKSAPLQCTSDYMLLDSSDMSIDEVVRQIFFQYNALR